MAAYKSRDAYAAERNGVTMNKYHNRKTVIDGITFDSKKEADYYCELRIRRMAHEITGFDMQVPFVLLEPFKYKGRKIQGIKYTADFVVQYPDGRKEIIDVKGLRTRDYIMRKKLLLSKYPDIDFVEV